MLLNTPQVNPAEIIAHFDSSEDREVVSKILIDEDDTTYNSVLNKYEISFWKEKMRMKLKNFLYLDMVNISYLNQSLIIKILYYGYFPLFCFWFFSFSLLFA